MRSELFRIPIEVAGIPLFGFGVLLLAWLVVSGVWAWRVARSEGGRAELMSLLPVLAIVAGGLIGLPRVMPAGLPIRGYGVMLVLAASAGLAMAVHRARRHGLDADSVLTMAFGMFILGIAGARLFFVIEYADHVFAQGMVAGLRKAVMFTEGGLVVYGSLIGGAVGFAWFCWRRRVAMLAMADILAPSLAVGLAIGRVGCLLNGCCFGGQCEQPWAVTFPESSPPYTRQLTTGQFHDFRWEQDPASGNAVVTLVKEATPADKAGLKPGMEIASILGQAIESPLQLEESIARSYAIRQPLVLGMSDGTVVTVPAVAARSRSLPVHPTQIYSAVNAGLLGWFLWLYFPHRRRDGEVILLLLTIYPVGRFLLEMIRIDESSFFGTGLSISQNVSLLLLGLMVPAWGYLLSRAPRRTEQLVAA